MFIYAYAQYLNAHSHIFMMLITKKFFILMYEIMSLAANFYQFNFYHTISTKSVSYIGIILYLKTAYTKSNL